MKTSILLFLVLVLVLLLISPFITIMALNLLGASIPFTFKTWIAVLWLHGVAASGKGSKS